MRKTNRKSPLKSDSIDWESIDFGRTLISIAREVGCAVTTVWTVKRKLYSGVPVRPWGGRRRLITEESVKHADWSGTFQEISRETGFSPSSLSLYAKRIGLPPRARGRKHGYKNVGSARWMEVDWSRKDREIAYELGVSRQAVNRRRWQLAPIQASR